MAQNLRFLARFSLGYLLLHLAYFAIPDAVLRDIFHHYGIVLGVAQLIEWIAPAEFIRAVANRLESPAAALEVVRGCDGAGVAFLLLAAVGAYRAPWRHRLYGALAAVGWVYFSNQLRLVILYFVAAYRPGWFAVLHVYVIPMVVLALSALSFMAWTAYSARRIGAIGSAQAI